MKILVAEDIATTRMILRRNLESWGYEVVEADDGEAAWAVLNASDPPPLALLDWMMPKVDGVEVCRRLRERAGGPFVYILLLTSKNEKEDLVKGLEGGAHDFLSKPVCLEELRARLAVGQRLVEAHRLKNRFLGMAAHDLRSPLTSIIGYAELLREGVGGAVSADQREFLELIERAGEHMLDLINHLLDHAAIENGHLALARKTVDLAPLAESRLRLLTVAAEKKEIELLADLETTPVRCDPDRIAQVMDNLISNAVKYSPPGSRVRMRVRPAPAAPGSAAIEVEDEGPGLAPEEIERIGGEFQRLSARPTGGEASVGLGLAIVKKIVGAHGGILEVESTPGEGALFRVRLPENGAGAQAPTPKATVGDDAG